MNNSVGGTANIAALFSGLITPENLKFLLIGLATYIGGALTFLTRSWWTGRDRYQVAIDWGEIGTINGPEISPVIHFQNRTEQALNITRLQICDWRRRPVAMFPYYSEDAFGPSMPLNIKPKERGSLALTDSGMITVAASAPSIITKIGLPRVYVAVSTMGGRKRRFVAEQGLPFNVRLSRYY